MDLNISSAPYLANEQGLILLREATAAVHIALNKINDLKKYVKQQRIMKADIVSHPTPMAANKSIKSEPFDEAIDIISIDDDSDVEEISREIARTKTMSFLNSHALRGTNVNEERINNRTNDYSLSSNNDSQACNSSSTLDVISPHLQVYFTIIHNSVTEFDIIEAFANAGFQDFEVIVKNKEHHSYGFIKFSNEESANRAVEMSLKILISGRTIKILPYNRDHAARKNATRSLENSQFLDYSNSKNHDSVHTIEENMLINISCGYERNRTNETFTPWYEGEMNEGRETNSCWYPDPHYVCNETSEFSRSQILPSPNVDQINRMFMQHTVPFQGNTNTNFSIENERLSYENIGYHINEHDKNIQCVKKNNSVAQKKKEKNNTRSDKAKNKKNKKAKTSSNKKEKKNNSKKSNLPILSRSSKKILKQLVLNNPNIDTQNQKELLKSIDHCKRKGTN